jgi:hypothetical protein
MAARARARRYPRAWASPGSSSRCTRTGGGC